MQYNIVDIKGINIVLAGDSDGITNLMIQNGTKDVTIDPEWKLDPLPFMDAEQQLREYFNGVRRGFNLRLRPSGTDYQKRVWRALINIPYGELHSYKQVATAIGNPKASRAVGMANNRNPIPIIVPCHRVIGSNKSLVGYAYGLELKRELIDLELINASLD